MLATEQTQSYFHQLMITDIALEAASPVSSGQTEHLAEAPTQERRTLSNLAPSVTSMASAASVASTSTSTWQDVSMDK